LECFLDRLLLPFGESDGEMLGETVGDARGEAEETRRAPGPGEQLELTLRMHSSAPAEEVVVMVGTGDDGHER
jgi:hypothetical protein